MLVMDDDSIPPGKYYLFIDRVTESGFSTWDSRAVRQDSLRDYLALRYSFEQPGVYRVQYRDSSRKVLATDSLTVSVHDLATARDYFQKGKLTACLNAKDGLPLDTLSSLKLGWEPIEISLIYRLDKPLRVRYFYLDVWRKSKKDSEAQFMETATFRLRPGWEYTEMKYEISKAGTYTFRLHNSEEVFLGSLPLQVEKID